ncbi:MAG: hypothetical protein DRR19_10275 [Candidatus Parabeggiatoa sp. nov. 1]|nr:MAG: hypothetical protein DRR19_10275 [Gammaproteobacteria bacterium]
MTKLVKLKIDEGNFEVGFKVTVEIGEDGKPYDTEFKGRLPSYPTIPNDYQGWRTNYLTLEDSWCGPVISGAKAGSKKEETIQLLELATDSATSFHSNFTNWLNSTDDKEFQFFKSKLCQKLGDESTEIRVIIQTEDTLLKKLPWHEWDLFADRYTNAEVAVGATEFEKPIFPVTSNQLRILAILGNSEGIDIKKDRETLESLESSQVHIEFLDEPNRAEISDELWKDNWNILCFSGHSSGKDEKGYFSINRTDDKKMTIGELKYGLREAIKRGLQLAIFNSCDGLKLAEDLADLNIPQVIFMREPVIDKVAHAFLKRFLKQFYQGESLYLAVRHARERLIEIGYDEEFPGSRWLPVIFQNPAVKPPSWRELKGFPKPPNPYRYLSPFREEDSEYFFGREPVIDRLQNLVEKQNFVMVLGASGSGKSSVVYAGLVPRLRQQKQWLIAHFRPQSNPFYQLAQVLVPLLHTDKQTQSQELTPVAKALYDDKRKLSKMVQDISKSHANQQLLLIVDQFEELYTSNSEEVQHRFLDQLLQVIEATSQQNAWENLPQFTLLITLRADFLGKVLDYAPFANLLAAPNDRRKVPNDIKLGSMVKEGLKEALEKPAEKQGVTIEAGLTGRILQDLEQAPGNLSLLEFAIAQLWKRMSDNIIRHKDYDAIGGIKQAIAKYANDFYKTLTPKEQATLRHIMVQLVLPGEGTDDTRQVATRRQIGEENWHLVIRLADARLVVTGRDKDTKQDTVELVHEALISHWERLQSWVNKNREALRLKRDIETAAKEWEAHGKSNDYLLQGPKLNIAEEYFNV